MSNKPNRGRGRAKKSKDPVKRDYAQVLRLCNQISGINRSLFRRVCAINTVTTSGAGVITNQDLASSASISSFADFSQLALLYTQYRAVAVKVTLMPYYPVNTTAVVVPATVIAAPWRGGLRPTSVAQFMETSERRFLSGYHEYTLTNHFNGDEDAHLWTQTSGAIAATESFGIACVGQSVGATATVNVWNLLVEWVVEFRVTG